MDIIHLIILFLFFTSLFTKSTSSKNDKYDECSTKFSCGILKDLGYPFYDGSYPYGYCGYPGFNLTCIPESPPKITISGQDYYLKKADKYNITVSRIDTWLDGCPDGLTNTTMDLSKFNLSSTNQNITFFYECQGNNDVLYGQVVNATCDRGSLHGFYLTQKMVEEHKSLNLFKNCKYIFIPVMESKANAVDDEQDKLEVLISAFEEGFDLGLVVNNKACDLCKGSKGVCGYDFSLNKFQCHCDDQDYDIQCGVNSSAGQDPATTIKTKGSKLKKPFAIGVIVGVVALLALLALGGWFVLTRRRRSKLVASQKTRGIHPSISNGEGGVGGFIGSNGLTSSQGYTTSSTLSQTTPSYTSSVSDVARDKTCYFGVRVFDYTELEHATCNFDDSKELGDGGFGTVYYGVLPDGRQVAVKRLYENSFKRVEQFMNEIRILADLHHKNLVALYGCTSRRSRELLLVYEYISNGTVADHIHGKLADTTFVPWHTRLSIAIETTEALSFLHRNDVIHRDVKTTNILLDNQFHVKVADFGLSRLFPTDMTHVSTAPQGTPGYVDPDYYICYKLTEKSDVYSFGVVLIELISSKHAVDITRHRHHVNLANMALDWIQSQEIHKLVDPRLGFDKDESIKAMVNMVGELGFRCLQQDRDMRPTMDEVMASLRAIQLEGLKAQKQEVVDIIVYGDDVGLLTNPTPPLSPELPRSNDVV